MSFDENNIIFKQYFIPDKYDKSLIFSKTLQDYIAGTKGLRKRFHASGVLAIDFSHKITPKESFWRKNF